MRLAEQLLAVVLRAYSQGPIAEAAELESILAARLWPPLAISPTVHDALMPFLNFQEYCRTGALSLCSPSASTLLLL